MKRIALIFFTTVLSSSLVFAANNKIEKKYSEIIVLDTSSNEYVGPVDNNTIFNLEVTTELVDSRTQKQTYAVTIGYSDKTSKSSSSHISIGNFSLNDAIALRNQMLNPNNSIRLECNRASNCTLRSIR